MTAQEKPHWSAETARKNTVGQPLLCPTAAATPGKAPPTNHPHLNPTPTIASGSSPPPRSSSFPRSFPRQLPPHVKGCLGSWYRGREENEVEELEGFARWQDYGEVALI